MKERDTFVDVAKGICILLIVCIHTEVFQYVKIPLTFLAVPMFFFMSGFYDRSEQPVSEWLPKVVRTLILPGVIWIAIGESYTLLLQYIKGEVYSYRFNVYNPSEGNGPAWFLFALLYVKLLVWVLSNVKADYKCILVLSLCVGYLGSKYQMPLLFDEGMAALPLYYLGKIMYPSIKVLSHNIYLALLGITGLILFFMGLVYYTIVPIANSCYTPYYLVAIVTIVVIFLPALYISSKLIKISSLYKLGSSSLGIMLIHAPMCHTAAVVLNRMFFKGSGMWIISFLVAYVVIVLLSYGLTKAIAHYCPILLGKK